MRSAKAEECREHFWLCIRMEPQLIGSTSPQTRMVGADSPNRPNPATFWSNLARQGSKSADMDPGPPTPGRIPQPVFDHVLLGIARVRLVVGRTWPATRIPIFCRISANLGRLRWMQKAMRAASDNSLQSSLKTVSE